MSDTVAILRKARDHIAQPGMWFQGGWSPGGLPGARDGQPCCASGAIEWALEQDQPSLPLERRVWDTLFKALPDEFEFIPPFNDAPGRTQAEVVALFDHAIELAEKEATA